MTALEQCFRILGNSSGTTICSAQYILCSLTSAINETQFNYYRMIKLESGRYWDCQGKVLGDFVQLRDAGQQAVVEELLAREVREDEGFYGLELGQAHQEEFLADQPEKGFVLGVGRVRAFVEDHLGKVSGTGSCGRRGSMALRSNRLPLLSWLLICLPRLNVCSGAYSVNKKLTTSPILLCFHPLFPFPFNSYSTCNSSTQLSTSATICWAGYLKETIVEIYSYSDFQLISVRVEKSPCRKVPLGLRIMVALLAQLEIEQRKLGLGLMVRRGIWRVVGEWQMGKWLWLKCRTRRQRSSIDRIRKISSESII